MSYCRFQNTAQDFQDCIDAIHEEEANELSAEEANALSRLLDQAKELIEMEDSIEEIIENFGR